MSVCDFYNKVNPVLCFFHLENENRWRKKAKKRNTGMINYFTKKDKYSQHRGGKHFYSLKNGRC